MANIKVAVRVRPISARELNLTGSEVVVRTDSNEISLTNLKVSSSKAGDSRERIRKYGFDYCFDSSNTEADDFADQERIYRTLGHTVLDAVFSGYNSCLVAYGQTASGKTYTMMGTKEDPGLTPRLCEGLFTRIEEERGNDRNYCVSVSYLEIYNERVRDLLKPSYSTGGLRVREHPRLGPYVQGLTQHVVRTLGSLMSYVEEGTRARKTASTLQNPSSSRSHALLTIGVAEDTQGVANAGVLSCSSTRRNGISQRGGSKLRLVDLAGSESAATCTGVHRLKEGANINKSLVALGNVISALAGRGSSGSGPGRRFVPYRDSSLTWLLKDALGGNATTIMLATISPASGSYNETAHTLRFAQRAQSVVNRPVVNEDPVARVVRELRAEIVRLKALLLEKNIEPDSKALCLCQNSSQKGETEAEPIGRSAEQSLEAEEEEEEEEVRKGCSESRVEAEGSKNLVPLHRSNSSYSATAGETGSSLKKFGSLESLIAGNRFRSGYNRAEVAELNDVEDEISEIHESVFVDIPTLVAVLIKPDDSLQETATQIEEICSDEAGEEPIDVGTIETVNDPGAFRKAESPRKKGKIRKQESVDYSSTSLTSNLHTSRRFGSEEAIQKRKDPIFSLERSHTNLENRAPGSDRLKKLNDIREIEDRKAASRSNWRGSQELLRRKGSNDSDKSLRESSDQTGGKAKHIGRKSSLENLRRKTSKDSSSSSSKDEQILISSLAKDKSLERKSSLEQELPATRSHTPIQRTKRAEIVAAVTERLYSSRKQAEDASGAQSPPERGEVKSMAKMKLQEISRKMLGKRRRVCVDTQTECSRTVRMKDTASLTDTIRTICQDVGVLTDDHAACEYVRDRAASVRRVKEIATSTDKPKASVARYRDASILANDLPPYDYEIHSPRNDSGILSDDTQNYAESNLSSTEVSDLCQEADRRVAYAESSTNTSVFSSCRSFASQTPQSEELEQRAAENKASVCLGRCCNSARGSRNRSSANDSERSVISICLPDTVNITIESRSSFESRIAVTDSVSEREKKETRRETSTKDGEAQTNEWNDLSNEIVPSKDQSRSTCSQTDSRVFRIENIFQDPNNVTNSSKVDRTTEGSRIRNSITFRNSLGTSYVSRPKEDGATLTGSGLDGEGFIRDGLITQAFITRKRGLNFRRPPSSAVYQDSWRNWRVPVSLANDESNGYAKSLPNIPFSEEAGISEDSCAFNETQMDGDSIASEEPVPRTVLTETVDRDHDHGFSDDSLEYNVTRETIQVLKAKHSMQRENFCPPDVVAHTKRDCPSGKSPAGDFDDSRVEFPKTDPTKSADGRKVHDYESLILGRPSYSCGEIDDDTGPSFNRTSSSGKKKVSFSNSNVFEKPSGSKLGSTEAPKSIVERRRKKNVSRTLDAVRSSNDETDDSLEEEKSGLFSESDWKGEVQSISSEETREDQDSVDSKGNPKQNRKKVRFSVEELSENTCTESDSYEDEDGEILSCAAGNIFEEYLSEAVTFMRNLNSINEYANGTSTLERYPGISRGGCSGKPGTRRRSWSSGRNRDCMEFAERKVSPQNGVDYSVEDEDVAISTESYERCLKGIQRLEDCFRRVDRHSELLREKYGVICESAGARPELASPSTDRRGPTSGTNAPLEKRFDVPKPERKPDDDDLERKIYEQLMNVVDSIRCPSSSKLETRSSRLSDSRPECPPGYLESREGHSGKAKEPFRDVIANLSLEETSEGYADEQDFTTYEVTGNLSVGKVRASEGSDDDLNSTMDQHFLPLKRFDRSPWLADLSDSPGRTRSPGGNLLQQRVPASGNFSTDKLEGREDYTRRVRDESWRGCACSKDHSGIESSAGEVAHFRDKLKYPASPRARFLELLRERRRIVEYSRGAIAS